MLRLDGHGALAPGAPYRILGPATSLMINRFATFIAADETWINFELADLAKTFGIGYNNGTNNPVIRSLERIDRFGFG